MLSSESTKSLDVKEFVKELFDEIINEFGLPVIEDQLSYVEEDHVKESSSPSVLLSNVSGTVQHNKKPKKSYIVFVRNIKKTVASAAAHTT